MTHPMWRLSEDTPDNLGLAFTDDGLMLGRTPLIERRGGRFVVRDRAEIERLLMYSFPQGCPVERIMPGLSRIAAALNANDQATARIAAVHLQIPDLPNVTRRNAMIAEDALIKYARDQGGDANWNPALHPRAGVPPNPGWFAPTDGSPHESNRDGSHGSERLRFAQNEDHSRRSDAGPATDEWVKASPGNPIDGPADFAGRFAPSNQPVGSSFWSDIWPGIRSWLQEPVPVHDLESGEVVGERPRWEALAPYIGIPIATAAIFGLEAFAPAIAAWLGLGGAAGVGEGAANIAAETITARTASGEFYSVAFETRLSPSSYPGVSRGVHFQKANDALLTAMENDPQFAEMIRSMGINLERTATGLTPRTPPPGWTWHHAESPGLIQLVPRAQHTPGSRFWDALHPGGRGGYALWGQR